MDRIIDLKKHHRPVVPQSPADRKDDVRKPSDSDFLSISWEGPLSIHSPNPLAAISFSIFVYLVALFFFLVIKEFLTGVFFALAGTLLLINFKKKPPIVKFTVGPLSIFIGEKEIKFSEIESFWIEYEPLTVKELSIKIKKWYFPYIKMPLFNKNPVQVRKILIKYIPEERHEDSAIESISRRLGF